MMNRLFKCFVLCLYLALTSCDGLHKISNTDLSYQYKTNHDILKPEYLIHHFSNDSSRLFVKIPVKGILYKRNDAGEMESLFNVRLIFFPAYENKHFKDSISFKFSPQYTTDSSAYVLKYFDFKRPQTNCLLAVRLNDLIRGAFKESFIDIDLSAQSQQRFLFEEDSSDIPLFDNVIEDDAPITITAINDKLPLVCRYYNREFPLALPPFSNKAPQTFSYASDSVSILAPASSEIIQPERKGIYHFQHDTLLRSGATLFKFDDNYPRVTDAAKLMEALRYLTTGAEYDKLQKAEDKKEAIDKFWLELSGSKERARFLIKTFYTRVQDANKYFTSYLEGWKSDRGMIYIVYGPPVSVYRTSEAEYWDYGNYKGYGNLNFSFKKIANPFTHNDCILVRSTAYEPVWYLAVDNWRQGRISTDE